MAAPSDLSRPSQRLWLDLHAGYSFSDAEVEVLRLALEALDRAAQARRALRADGLWRKNRFGDLVAHPAIKVEKDSAAAAVRFFQALALPEDAGPASVHPIRKAS